MNHFIPLSIVSSPTVPAEAVESLHALPIYSTASPEHQALLDVDLAAVLADGIPLTQYLTDLAAFGTAENYLRDTGRITVEAVKPVADYATVLQRFEHLAGRAAEGNYCLAALGLQAVRTHLSGTGAARRSDAVAELAQRLIDADPEMGALYREPGAAGMRSLEVAHVQAVRKVNNLIHGGALLQLLYGATAETPVVCQDGIARKAASKANPAMPWRRVRELFPLVRRVNPHDETSEVWTLLPHIGADAQALAHEIVAHRLTAEAIVSSVRTLCVESAQRRLQSGDKSAVDDLRRWGQKIAKAPRTASRKKATPIEDDAADVEATDMPTDAPGGNTSDTTPAVEPAAVPEKAATPPAYSAAPAELEDVTLLADMAVELITDCDAPDDLFAALLRQLKKAGLLCTNSLRALDAALVVLDRSASS